MSAAFTLADMPPDTVLVSGELSFSNAAAALGAIGRALAAGRVRLDLAGVSSCDSAGLACVLALAAEAAGRGQPISVVNEPAGMRALAKVCDVEPMLERPT